MHLHRSQSRHWTRLFTSLRILNLFEPLARSFDVFGPLNVYPAQHIRMHARAARPTASGSEGRGSLAKESLLADGRRDNEF